MTEAERSAALGADGCLSAVLRLLVERLEDRVVSFPGDDPEGPQLAVDPVEEPWL